MSNRDRVLEILKEYRKQDKPTARVAERLEAEGLITPDAPGYVPYWYRNAQKAQTILHDSYWKVHTPERMAGRLEGADLIALETAQGAENNSTKANEENWSNT